MKLCGVASREAAKRLRSVPRIAVDLGFSGRSKSTGIAARGFAAQLDPANLMFAECVRVVAGLSAHAKEFVLIVEAPLSAAFDPSGNPQARGEFETQPKARWWSLGPGAVMSLAAQHFLRRLAIDGNNNAVLYLVEAFVAGADSGDHKLVANNLLVGFDTEDAERWHEPRGSKLESIVEWLPGQVDRAIPIVLSLASAQ